jgi:hypothetical protein
MTENGEKLYDLMLRIGYPDNFSRIIAEQMQTEYTSQRMCAWLGRAGLLPAEEVADEMLSILAERDRLVQKHIAMHAQKKINQLYMEGLDPDDEEAGEDDSCDESEEDE